MTIVLVGRLNGLSATNALAHSLAAIKGPKRINKVHRTGTPSFVTDVLLAVRDLNSRAGSSPQGITQPTVLYPRIKDDASAGHTQPSDLLSFLLVECGAGYPCIIDGNVRSTIRTKRLSRISPLTAVADTVKIAFRGELPVGQSTEVAVPMLARDDVDGLRNRIHHWIRPMDGLDLSGLLRQDFEAFRAAFEQWDENWHDRHHWRSFYAVCLWFSFLPDRLPTRNDVHPGNACWKKWGRLFEMLYDDCWNEAAELFKDNQKALNYCIQWIHKV